MGRKNLRYSAPDKYIVIPKDDWFIFYDPVHFSFTRVSKVAEEYNISPTEIEEQVSSFLEDMTATKFIHVGPYKPDLSEPPDLENSKPKSVYIHPTFKCNLKCIYCYNAKERKEQGDSELTTDEWFSIMDQVKDLGGEQIVFTGGEPLLRKDIFELGKFANSIGLTCSLLTNAMLISEKNIKDVTATFVSVRLSLDSHIEAHNDFHRGKGTYQRTMNAIKLLHEQKHPWSITAVVTKHNVDDIPGLYKFLLEEFESVDISPNLYIPTSPDHVDFIPKMEDYFESMYRANEVVEDYYGEDRLAILSFHGIPGRQFHCGAGAGEVSLGPDGSVYPCQALQKDEFMAGNIKDNSLKDIYHNSPIMKKMRSCTVENIEVCRDCDVKHLCGGGCRSLAYNLFGTIDCHNSYSCEYLRNVAYNQLWNSTCVPIDQLRKMEEERKVKEEAKSEA
jgi:radical SAM protein with 4Fe4S-binding SPASM domain